MKLNFFSYLSLSLSLSPISLSLYLQCVCIYINIVDPDLLRMRLPETGHYYTVSPDTAGSMTQLEVSLMAELLIEAALGDYDSHRHDDDDDDTTTTTTTTTDKSNNKNRRRRRSILIDGTLRDGSWYYQFVEKILQKHPEYSFGIIVVTASLSAAKSRSIERESLIFRKVPESLIEDTYRKVSLSVGIMKPLADIVVYIQNEAIGIPFIKEISMLKNPHFCSFPTSPLGE